MWLLSFLGTSPYQETTYVWVDPDHQKHSYTTPYASVASARFLEANHVYVLATQEARAIHGEALARGLEGLAPLDWVMIPNGASEAEMWEIYMALGERVPPEAEISLDVTHGFRHVPLIIVLATAFLRVTRNLQLKHVLYGAYEARDVSVQPSRTPVFDLGPMFALLEWANAADRFVRQGDARDLATLLRRGRPPHGLQKQDPRAREWSLQIGTLAKSLDEVSANLLLSRPHRAMVAAAKLGPRLSGAQDLPLASRPFLELLDQVTDAFGWLALDNPTHPDNLWENLERQRELIRWYADRGHYVHACILAREWVISWRLLVTGGRDLLDRDERVSIENELGRLSASERSGSTIRSVFPGVPHEVNLGQLWNKLTQARNDVAHVIDRPEQGKGASAVPTPLIDEIEWCLSQIERFDLPSGAKALQRGGQAS